MRSSRLHNRDWVGRRFWVILVWLAAFGPSFGQTVVFHLRNGDRLTGTIVSEGTNGVVIATAFAGNITLPLAEIQRRESLHSATAAVKSTATTNTPSAAASVPKSPAQTPASSPPPSVKPAARQATNTVAAARSGFRKMLSEWKGDLEVGLNLGFSSKERQTYSGRFKAAHLHPTQDQKLLKNTLDYLVTYGRADGVLADNRMDGSWKVEYDVGKRFSFYNVAGAGYDEVRRIDLQYDVGPGVGYKWLNLTNFVLKTELGANYQEQFFANDLNKRRYSLRLAEESAWQISSRIRFDEKVEFFPQLDGLSDFRVRLETNLAYLLRNNLALKLTVIDLYETDPAINVSNNDLQIRSSISIKF